MGYRDALLYFTLGFMTSRHVRSIGGDEDFMYGE
jgi:hypothetical protein